MRIRFLQSMTVLAALVVAPSAAASTGDFKLIQGLRGDSVNGAPLDQANGIDISPDGRHVYVAAQIDDSVSVFKRNAKTGKLRFVEAERDGQGGVTAMNGPRDVKVSPDGENVYVVATDDNGLVEFDRSKKSGRLTFSDEEVDGQNGVANMASPEQIAIPPSGAQVYVTSLTEDGVTFFHRGDGDGLQLSGGLSSNDHHNGASGIAISPDGGTVLVGGFQGDQIASYKRSENTGFLTYKDGLIDGLFAEGLNGPRGIAFNKQGTRAFVAGQGDDALTWLDVDQSDQTITYRDDLTPNPEVFALGDPFGVTTVGPDVYVASFAGGSSLGAVGAYKVLSNIALTEFDSVRDGDGKAETLGRSTEIVASPDGAFLYSSAGSSAGSDDDAVNAFARDEALKLTAKGQKEQKAGSLRVKVRCSTACTLSAKARAGAFDSKAVKKKLAPDKRKTLKLSLPSAAAGQKAKVLVKARDAFGEKAAATKKVALG